MPTEPAPSKMTYNLKALEHEKIVDADNLTLQWHCPCKLCVT